MDPDRDPSPLSKGGRGEEPTSYRHEPPISQQTRAILDAVAEVQEIKKILQKQESRWASFLRSLKQFINLIN